MLVFQNGHESKCLAGLQLETLQEVISSQTFLMMAGACAVSYSMDCAPGALPLPQQPLRNDLLPLLASDTVNTNGIYLPQDFRSSLLSSLTSLVSHPLPFSLCLPHINNHAT